MKTHEFVVGQTVETTQDILLNAEMGARDWLAADFEEWLRAGVHLRVTHIWRAQPWLDLISLTTGAIYHLPMSLLKIIHFAPREPETIMVNRKTGKRVERKTDV